MENSEISPSPIRIDVFALPDLVPDGYRPEAAVFIDVLRATTTMTTALAAGAKKIIPIADPQEVLRLKASLIQADPTRADQIVTGGERKGVRIEGFDFGNSPSSYSPETVGGKTILFSTTNGTRAILTFEKSEKNRTTATPSVETNANEMNDASHAAIKRPKGGPSVRQHASESSLPNADRTTGYLASFLNAASVVDRLWTRSFRTIGIVCAGTDRNVTQEDNLVAGLLVSRLFRLNAEENTKNHRFGENAQKILLNVQAETVRYQWDSFVETTTPETFKKGLRAELLASRGGQNVKRIGLTADLDDVVRLDSVELVPEYRLGEIRPDTAFEES